MEQSKEYVSLASNIDLLTTPLILTIIGFILIQITSTELNNKIAPVISVTIFNLIITKIILIKKYYSIIFINEVTNSTIINFIGIETNVYENSVSLIFLLLTSYICPICLFIQKGEENTQFCSLDFSKRVNLFWKKTFILQIDQTSLLYRSNITKTQQKFILNSIFLIEALMLILFETTDLFIFFSIYEIGAIPLIILIKLGGKRSQRIRALNYFMLFTLLSSLSVISGLLALWSHYKTTSILIFCATDHQFDTQFFSWWFLSIPFLIKTPTFPFHLWLPEAHVEAPTVGSIILASIILKVGGYGFIRIIIPIFKALSIKFAPIVITMAIFSIVFSSIEIFRLIDLKKIIAYSSIIHMNFALIGVFQINTVAQVGSIFIMFSHGLTASGLFLCAGLIYRIFHTRIILYYSGLIHYMPLLGLLFLFFCLSNFSFPGTSPFIGELIVLIGLSQLWPTMVTFPVLSILLSALYMLILFSKLFFFNYHTLSKSKKSVDIDKSSFLILLNLSFIIVLTGLKPNLLLEFIKIKI